MQAGAIKKKPKGLATLFHIQNARHLVQLAFIAFIGYVTFVHMTTPESSGVTTTSPEAFCPFGGFETLYKWITSGGSFVPHTHLSNLVLFIAVIVLTLITRSSFCGWICPFGTIQEAIMGLSYWLQRHVRPVKSAIKWLQQRASRLSFLDHWLRYLKYFVLAWIIWGTITYGVMVFREIDPWAALITITEAESVVAVGVLIVVLVASFFVERPFCRYACPLGLINGLVGKLSPIKIQRESNYCAGCNVCEKKCPLNIPVAHVDRVSAVECNMCLNCIAACPRGGALDLRLILPGVKA